MKIKNGIEFKTKKKKSKEKVTSDEKLLNEIRNVCRMIDEAYARFEVLKDKDLLDASIYEIEALKSRYNYLLRLARTKSISCNISSTTVYEKI